MTPHRSLSLAVGELTPGPVTPELRSVDWDVADPPAGCDGCAAIERGYVDTEHTCMGTRS